MRLWEQKNLPWRTSNCVKGDFNIRQETFYNSSKSFIQKIKEFLKKLLMFYSPQSTPSFTEFYWVMNYKLWFLILHGMTPWALATTRYFALLNNSSFSLKAVWMTITKKEKKNSVRLSVLRGEKTAITKKRKPKKHPSPVFRTLRFSQRTKYHLTFFTVLIMLLSMK